MRVYATDRGVRTSKRRYQKVAGLTRPEASFFKRRGALDVNRETADILISKGWGSADPGHPLVEGRGSGFGKDQPIRVETQELQVEETTETAEEPPVLESDGLQDEEEGDDAPEAEEPPEKAPEAPEESDESEEVIDG